jgi:hypothetical protein
MPINIQGHPYKEMPIDDAVGDFQPKGFLGEKVDIYKNLHNGLWSILDRKTRCVVGHVRYACVEEPKFIVQPAGRRRVLKENRKNVHAFVRGVLKGYGEIGFFCYHTPLTTGTRPEFITYNPFKFDTFIHKNNEEPIHKARWAHLTTKGVYVND